VGYQVHRQRADADLLPDACHRAADDVPPQHRQHDVRPDGWVARHRQLSGGREEAHADVGLRIRRGEHEGCLREIHLAGDLLQLVVAEPFSLGEPGDGVAAEDDVGKYVGLDEVVASQVEPPVCCRPEFNSITLAPANEMRSLSYYKRDLTPREAS